jgi:hypothetical protein
MAVGKEPVGQVGPDESGDTGDKSFHDKEVLLEDEVHGHGLPQLPRSATFAGEI